jgi:hypothetical protein
MHGAAQGAANAAGNAAGSAGNAMQGAAQGAANAAGGAAQGAANAAGAMGNAAGGMASAATKPNCGAVQAVWVNLATKRYHLPGDPAYGRSRHGEYLCPSQAQAQGFRPARRRTSSM